MIPHEKAQFKPIIAKDDDDFAREIGGEWHIGDCPCKPCEAARLSDAERWAAMKGTELEPVEDAKARAARIIAEWATLNVTQRGLASAFIDRFDGTFEDGSPHINYRQEYRFDKRRGRWMEFKEGRWMEAHTILDALGELVETLCGDGEGSEAKKAKWGKLNVYKDVLTLAKEHLTVDNWDDFWWLMGLPNGDLWDLEVGWSRSNYRRLPVTKTTGVDPDEFLTKYVCRSACTCLWHSFLGQVTGGDMDMLDSLQINVGASLFGGNREHRLNVVCGDGGTGKGVFLNTVAKALGDYAGAMPASVLASKGNDHPTGMAGVVDKRFVVVPEVNAGTWKEEALKSITGGDLLPVRYMRQDFFVVQPDCTLWVSSNQPPTLRMVDNAIKRRLRIWPFDHKPAEVDTRLGEKLQEPAMLAKVLQWALKGAELYAKLKGELQDCDAVKEATRDYFTDVDTIGAWLAAGTTPSQIPEHDTGAATAYKHYSAWCEKEGQKPTSRTAWGISLGRRVGKRNTKRGKFYSIELEGDGLGDGFFIHSLTYARARGPIMAQTRHPTTDRGVKQWF